MANDSKYSQQRTQQDSPVRRTSDSVPAGTGGKQPVSGKPSVGGSKPSGGKKRTLLIVLACVVVAVAAWVLIWLFACGGSSMFDPNAQTGQAPYKTDEEMQAELNRTVEEGMFNISIASVIDFEDGNDKGTAYIENVPANRYNMQVVITSDDTGEVLYESGVLQPNQYIENITLTRDLDAGSYDATATFSALDPTTYDQIGQAAAKVSINVLG